MLGWNTDTLPHPEPSQQGVEGGGSFRPSRRRVGRNTRAPEPFSKKAGNYKPPIKILPFWLPPKVVAL